MVGSPPMTGRAVGPSPAAMGRRLVGYGISLLALLSIPVAAGDVLNPAYPGLMRVGVALCLLAQLLVVAECLRPTRLLPGIAVLGLLGLLSITLGLVGTPPLVPAPGWRSNTWFGPLLQFFLLLHRRRYVWLILSVLLLACWGAVTVVQNLDWRIQVMDLVFTITPIVTLGVGGACITNLLVELRLSRLRRRRDERESIAEEMRAQHRRMRTRLMHDSVLHTLQQISRGWAPPTPQEASVLASSSAMELQLSAEIEGAARVDVRSALEQALAEERCVITWRGTSAVVPAPVCEAMVAATREAIRNVVKHAHGSAVVTISRATGGCRITITDDGPGVPATALDRRRLGLSESILHRMEDVGGQASIRSDIHGTSVRLEWLDEPFGRAEPFGPVTRTLISWLPLPVLVASLVHVIVLDVGPSAVGALLLWLATAAVALLCIVRLRSTGLAPWQPPALTLLAITVIVANYAWISPVGTNGYDVWTPTLAGALMVLALPGRRLSHAVVLGILVILGAVTGCVLFLGWSAVFGSQLGSIMAVVMYVLTPLALATGASILAEHSRRTEELHAARQLRLEVAADEEVAHREWADAMRRLAEPFLLRVATGAADPGQEEVVREARILELRLRDEVALWPHGSGVTERVHGLRVAGWDCTLDVHITQVEEKEALLHLISLLPPPVHGQRLHILTNRGEAVATITNPPLTLEQRHQLSGAVVALQDEDFTQLRSAGAVHAAPPAPCRVA